MPTDFLQSNTAFPRFTGQETTEDKVGALTDYTYMLLKQLRYTLNNLGVGNWNDKELSDWAGTITAPINVRLNDNEGNLSTLLFTVTGLVSSVSDIDGNYSTLSQTVGGLSSTVSTLDGNYSTLSQTVSGISSTVSTLSGNYSTLSQTVSGISSTVSTLDGNYSTLSQTVDGIALSAVSVDGSSMLKLNNGSNDSTVSLSLSVSNSTGSSTIALKSGNITLATSGDITLGGNVVFTSNLTDGETEISGDNITSGEITGITLNSWTNLDETYGYMGYSVHAATGSVSFGYKTGGGYEVPYGSLHSDNTTYNKLILETTSSAVLKLYSGSDLSIEAAGMVYIGNVYIMPGSVDPIGGWCFASDGIYYGGNRKVNAAVNV